MAIEVIELSDDGLSGKIWEFNLSAGPSGAFLVLTFYGEQTRETKRHKFRGKKWVSMDERSYMSQLPRPTEIPKWVILEAVSKIELNVAIGWSNRESITTTIKVG